jgi:predicted nucleotidyltransferase
VGQPILAAADFQPAPLFATRSPVSAARDKLLATLRAHEPALRAAGVVRLSLFGSTARGDRRHDSDIDLLAAFDETRRISLLAVARIEIQLSELLGQPVDLIEEGTLKPRVQRAVEAEAVRAF